MPGLTVGKGSSVFSPLVTSYDLLVDVVFGSLGLGDVLRVSDEPQSLVTGKRQGHEDVEGLWGMIGTQNREER